VRNAQAAHQLHEGQKIDRAITILAPASELFTFWRDFTNLPRFMSNIESIQLISSTHTHWRWRSIGGLKLEWDAEVIAEIEDRMISWQTLPGSNVAQAGSVWFRPAPQDDATEVHVQLLYHVPGGKFTKTIARLLGGEPAQTLSADLRRLKWIFETGEVPTTRGQPHGSTSRIH
jgi:uncharacterized membrane protein